MNLRCVLLLLAFLVPACGEQPSNLPDARSGCETACTIGQSECVGDRTRTCLDQGSGCPVWGPLEDCPAEQPFCSNGRCEASCVDECTAAGERRCHEVGFQLCGDSDSDPCLDWSAVIACGPEELCRATDAQCVPSCGGAACSCAAGETMACADIGECSGGFRQCVAGEFGPCQWQTSPQPEECDGLDNDCNGTADDPALLAPPPCALEAGVCAGATQPCGGGAGWLACTGSVYLAHATASGDTYQVSESLCDGQDNDCDGATDEPAQCCTPACAGATCGAPDGCGGVCQDGACPANETCDMGTCEPVPPAPVWQQLTPITTQALTGIWGSSASNIWVTGTAGTLLHYNGTQWSSVLSGTTLDLEDVWGTGPNDVWVVGGTQSQGGIVLHYNGSQWSQVATPSNTARAIWGTSPTNIFVAGGDTTFGYVQRYNGTAWTFIHSSNASRFLDVSGQTGSDVWVIDLFYAHHYNGTAWSSTQLTTTLMRAIWSDAPNQAWAVGQEFNLQRHDGTSWQEVTSPLGGGNNFGAAVWGRAVNDVWVVGTAGGIMHFDGAGWQLAGPVPAISATLYDVWGTSATNVWAVGSSGTIVHYTPN